MSLNRFNAILRLSAIRQTLWLLVLFTLITLVAWGGTYLLVRREMLNAVDARLAERMRVAVEALDAGEPLPAPERAGQTTSLISRNRPDGFQTRDAPGSHNEMRYLVRNTANGRIMLGEDTEQQEELQDILAGGMQLSVLASVILTGLAGLWMARRAQSRLNMISEGLGAVAQGDLDTRIELDGQDDLTLLAGRINETTERLETAMTQMRVQSSNIAHDLRTPLARLRAQIESSLISATEHDKALEPKVLEDALVQIDRLTGTFDALLRLARLESGAGRDAFEGLDLEALVADVSDTFAPVVEDVGQVLRTTASNAGRIYGDRDLLVQLLANLIQNALRYGADAQTITLGVHGTELKVSDEGPGIPTDERENVLQPLYQGETTRQVEGFGIGLSLVRAIAELHSATLTLTDGPHGRGLCVTVKFPGTDSV